MPPGDEWPRSKSSVCDMCHSMEGCELWYHPQ